MQIGKLKKNFMWGGSVSAHQSEGGVGTETGKGKSIYDVINMKEGCSDWDNAIDTYHHFREDAALFKEMGMNAYRFSIAWSRVMPDGENEINEKGLAFYDEFIDSLLENEIEPIICTYHFDTPLALQLKYKGWISRETVNAYEKYVRLIVERYGKKVKYWLPMNEQNGCVLVGLLSAGIEAGSPDFEKAHTQIFHNLMIASAKMIKAVRELAPQCQVGGMINHSPIYPERCKPADVLTSLKQANDYSFDMLDIFIKGKYPQRLINSWEKNNVVPKMEEGDLELLEENTVSFIAISYYTSIVTNAENENTSMAGALMDSFVGQHNNLPENPYLSQTDWGWKIDPIGLRISLNQIYERYQVPIFIVENGIGVKEELNQELTVRDEYRIEYLREHIQQMKLAILEDGVDCMGYLTWGPIDILSSHGEMCKRYGFIYVNRTDKDLLDLKRYRKQSFDWFKTVIESQGEIL